MSVIVRVDYDVSSLEYPQSNGHVQPRVRKRHWGNERVLEVQNSLVNVEAVIAELVLVSCSHQCQTQDLDEVREKNYYDSSYLDGIGHPESAKYDELWKNDSPNAISRKPDLKANEYCNNYERKDSVKKVKDRYRRASYPYLLAPYCTRRFFAQACFGSRKMF